MLGSSIALAAPVVAAVDGLDWSLLREGAEAWRTLAFDADFSLNVGDESGSLFRYETPNFSSSSTRMAGASLSKWPAAVMVAGLVHDRILHFDDLASKHLSWWTTDPSDPRSRVRLHHLLSFTSGWYEDGMATPWCGHGHDPFMACAHSLYNHSTAYGAEPGANWTYLSCHLQFAGAMAVAASGMPIYELFERYLYKPFNMTSTTWTPRANPMLAVGITTTANDFEQLLKRLLTYEVLPRSVLDVMETDSSKPPCTPSGDGWFGHYGMGHWWECIGYGTPPNPYERLPLPEDCVAAHVQAGPGLFGYYPLLDRSGGGGSAGPARRPYYFQIAIQEPTALSGIPEYLRLLAKPVVDVILNGSDPRTHSRERYLADGAGLLMRDLNDIRSALKRCVCARHPFRRGEPFGALAANLSADNPNRTRRELTRMRGEGLLLAEVVEAQRQLGRCACTGRRDATPPKDKGEARSAEEMEDEKLLLAAPEPEP